MTVRMGRCSRCEYGPTPVAELGLCWHCLCIHAYALMAVLEHRAALQEPAEVEEVTETND